MKESDIIFQVGAYTVRKDRSGLFSVWNEGATHATSNLDFMDLSCATVAVCERARVKIAAREAVEIANGKSWAEIAAYRVYGREYEKAMADRRGYGFTTSTFQQWLTRRLNYGASTLFASIATGEDCPLPADYLAMTGIRLSPADYVEHLRSEAHKTRLSAADYPQDKRDELRAAADACDARANGLATLHKL